MSVPPEWCWVRQRTGSARASFCFAFMTLEDETGITNTWCGKGNGAFAKVWSWALGSFLVEGYIPAARNR